MFEQAFKNIDDVLWKEAGCTTELDYTEQTSWLLFLKYLDGLEEDRAMEAQLEGKKYSYILSKEYRWETWAAPKGQDGKLDHNKAQTGDDLTAFVNQKLFPYLHGFTQKASGPDTIEYKIGQIFGEIKNKISSGYNMREIIDHIDELRFRSQAEKHELSHLYEAKIKNMGNAGRNGGEYYTPRPLIRAIIQVVRPRIGERIYDGAVGSAGFLCEAYEYLKQTNPKRTTAQDRLLQERTFYGKEKKSLAYVIAIMNMILHGIEAPNILHTNTLTENLADVQDKDRYDVVLAIALVITLALVVWIVLRIRRIDLPPGADFLTALRATPLIVVIVLDLLDFSLDIFSTPITWAVLTYLRLAPLRLVAVVKDLIPITNFIPLMTLCWLYARFKNDGAIPSGTDVPQLRP